MMVKVPNYICYWVPMVQNNYSLLPDNNDDNAGSALDLKAIRESKGLTLKDIFKITRISVVNLEAIENNDLHLLPAPVYTKTFIKTYAKALGVDSKNILERYAKHLESLKETLPEEQAKISAQKKALSPPVLIWSIATLIFCSLIFLSFALHDKTEMDVSAPVHPPQTTKVVDGSSQEAPPADVSTAASTIETAPVVTEKAPVPPKVVQQKDPVVETVKPPAPIPVAVSGDQNRQKEAVSPARYRLSITARELTWLKIVSDQNPPYEILLKPGDKIDRSATKSFQVDIGNAGGIDVEFQGKSTGSLGKSGEVIHLNLP